MPKPLRLPRKSTKHPPIDGDGNHIHDEILCELPAQERETLLPKLEFLRLNVHHVLHEPGDTLKSEFVVRECG